MLTIGPYDENTAESLTEELLDSKQLYQDLELVLRGEMDRDEFWASLERIAEIKHERMQQDAREEREALEEVS